MAIAFPDQCAFMRAFQEACGLGGKSLRSLNVQVHFCEDDAVVMSIRAEEYVNEDTIKSISQVLELGFWRASEGEDSGGR